MLLGAFAFFLALLIMPFFNLFTNEPNYMDHNVSGKPELNEFEIVAENLFIPWEIDFLPDGGMLVTERPGNLVRITESRQSIKVEGVSHRGEGGLLGLALHPDFEQNNLIYLYFTSSLDGKIENRVESYRLDIGQNELEEKKVILSGIPGASNHDGGRIEFGPDRYLYITTGDAGNPANSQNENSLAGKILKVDENGTFTKDNPFGNEVYSYGHRNPQGLAWDEDGNLWSTEHGRSGAQSGYDELNIIMKGKNYGWNEIQGDEKKVGMETPVLHSGSSETWAPAGAAYYKGNIFFTGLRGETLYVYNIENKSLAKHFQNKFGRLRAIIVYNGSLYFSTSNLDGRGSAGAGDDKIIKINLAKLI